MKAKEYYAKYGERLMKSEERYAALNELVIEFVTEAEQMIIQRKATTNKAVLSIIDELNNKWNALCDMFPTRILTRNAYQKYLYLKLGITKETADIIRQGKM